MNPFDYSNPANLTNPLSPINPIGILNPASPIYIGRDTQAVVEQPAKPMTDKDYFANGVGLGVIGTLSVEAIIFFFVMLILAIRGR